MGILDATGIHTFSTPSQIHWQNEYRSCPNRKDLNVNCPIFGDRHTYHDLSAHNLIADETHMCKCKGVNETVDCTRTCGNVGNKSRSKTNLWYVWHLPVIDINSGLPTFWYLDLILPSDVNEFMIKTYLDYINNFNLLIYISFIDLCNTYRTGNLFNHFTV